MRNSQLYADEKIQQKLREIDPRLGLLIDKYGEIRLALAQNYFESLASSIVGQQLSNRVANAIWNRLVDFLGGDWSRTPPPSIKAPANYQQIIDCGISPQSVLRASIDQLRQVGLSINKATYLQNLSQAVLDGSVCFDRFDDMTNEDIIESLTTIKGIGRWTAEMFLIFSLGREDVFSLGDVGLQNAAASLYGVGQLTKPALKQISERWSPYRTFASLYLWKSLDNE